MRVSIIINNYNYGRFVRDAIESALAQEDAVVEVIVVDDGSTDDSRRIIESYGDRVTPVFKPNGGQASALNTGAGVATGDVILFLDADDVLLPHAAAGVAHAFAAQRDLAKVAWPMEEIDHAGRRTGRRHPQRPLDTGDCLHRLVERGPFNVIAPPTSGNAFARRVIDSLLPMPEERFRTCADGYLLLLAPLFGPIAALAEPQSLYRIHGDNALSGGSEFDRVNKLRANAVIYRELLARKLHALGVEFEPLHWRSADGYLEWVAELADAIEQHVPLGGSFILIDEGRLNVGTTFRGRRRRFLIEQDGNDGGRPADEAPTDAMLRAHRDEGVTHLFITPNCSWWLDHYIALSRFLHDQATRLDVGRSFAWVLGTDVNPS